MIVVSPAVKVDVLPVFTVVVVVVVVPVVVVVVGLVPVPVPPFGATQFTLVADVVQLVLKFESPFSVLLTQPDMLVAAINNARP